MFSIWFSCKNVSLSTVKLSSFSLLHKHSIVCLCYPQWEPAFYFFFSVFEFIRFFGWSRSVSCFCFAVISALFISFKFSFSSFYFFRSLPPTLHKKYKRCFFVYNIHITCELNFVIQCIFSIKNYAIGIISFLYAFHWASVFVCMFNVW